MQIQIEFDTNFCLWATRPGGIVLNRAKMKHLQNQKFSKGYFFDRCNRMLVNARNFIHHTAPELLDDNLIDQFLYKYTVQPSH